MYTINLPYHCGSNILFIMYANNNCKVPFNYYKSGGKTQRNDVCRYYMRYLFKSQDNCITKSMFMVCSTYFLMIPLIKEFQK